MAFVALFAQIKLLHGLLVIQFVWYILKQLFTSVSVKVVDIYLAASLNRSEWSPIRSVIIRVINKIGRVNHEYDYRLNWTTRSPVTN